MIISIVRTLCLTCFEPVLLAPTKGGVPVLAEIPEILPRERCRECLSGRLLRHRCWRCGAEPWEGPERRYVGEDLTGALAVGIDPEGYAHVFIGDRRKQRRRSDGSIEVRHDAESVHRAHQCALVPALVA